MKLFILAALIAVSSAARLEHLERGYLPPDQTNQLQGFGGQGSRGSSNGFGAQGSHSGSNSFGTQDFGSNGADSTGFGSSPAGTRTGPAAQRGGSSFNAATSNQYLPPDHGPSAGFPRPNGGAHSQDAFGASSNQNQFGAHPSFGSQGSNGFGSHGSNGFGSHGSNGFGSHGSNGFGSHGSHGFGSQGSNGFGSQGSNGFGSQGSNGFGSHGSNGFSSHGSNGFGAQNSNTRSQQGGRFDASRQYLAPKTSSSFDNIPQQSFDEETGYHY